jgi:nicotinamide mononucleotide adenylyltransferase
MTHHNDDENDLHVLPIDDLREHSASRRCWCRPTPDDEEPHVFVHHAMDGREQYERGERKPS